MLPNQERRPCNHEETVSPAGAHEAPGWRGYPLLGALLLLVAGLLTGCPSKALGSLGVGIYATNTERCDDRIKVEVEFNASGLSDGLASYVPEEENVYGGGANWVWVKPGKTSGMGWFDDPYDSRQHLTRWARNGQRVVHAHQRAVAGESVREFNLNDYQKP